MAQSEAPKQAQSGPPWIRFKTFLHFIEWLGEVGVPQKIERSFWGKKLAGNTGPPVLSALEFFGLVDGEHHATTDLDAIAKDPDKRREFMKRKLAERYKAVLDKVKLERATRGQLSEEFTKAFGVRGSVLVKSVIFFVHMAKYAGLDVSSHIVVRERGESKPRKKREPEERRDKKVKPEDGSREEERNIQDIAMAQSSLLLWGLFKRLPKPGSSWSKAEREQWVATLNNVLAMEYKE